MSTEIQDLAAAIRDALTVPQGADFAAMTRQDALLGTRAAHVRAAMNGLATGTTGLTETVELVSLAAEWHPVTYPTRDEQPTAEPERAETSPLGTYLDAVSDALKAAGVEVDTESIGVGEEPTLGVDLARMSAGRVPVMAWTPDTGWRIAMANGTTIDPTTIRYLGEGFAPYPAEVAAAVVRWLENPASVSDVQPVYPVHAKATVLSELARAVRDDARGAGR